LLAEAGKLYETDQIAKEVCIFIEDRRTGPPPSPPSPPPPPPPPPQCDGICKVKLWTAPQAPASGPFPRLPAPDVVCRSGASPDLRQSVASTPVDASLAPPSTSPSAIHKVRKQFPSASATILGYSACWPPPHFDLGLSVSRVVSLAPWGPAKGAPPVADCGPGLCWRFVFDRSVGSDQRGDNARPPRAVTEAFDSSASRRGRVRGLRSVLVDCMPYCRQLAGCGPLGIRPPLASARPRVSTATLALTVEGPAREPRTITRCVRGGDVPSPRLLSCSSFSPSRSRPVFPLSYPSLSASVVCGFSIITRTLFLVRPTLLDGCHPVVGIPIMLRFCELIPAFLFKPYLVSHLRFFRVSFGYGLVLSLAKTL